VTLDGLDQIVGVAGQNRYLSLSLVHDAGRLSCSIAADVTFSPTFQATLLLPEGDYATVASVDLADVGPSNAGAGGTFQLGKIAAGNPVALALPQVARITGTLLDPSLSLAPSPGPNDTIPRHSVYVRSVGSDVTGYYGISRLSGFQRGFKAFVPRGTPGNVSGSFEIRLGEPPADADDSENTTGVVLISPSATPVRFDADGSMEFTIPSLPRYVTLEGRLVRADGTPSQSAYIQAYSGSLEGSNGGFRTIVNADRDGRFRLRLLPGSDYTLYVIDYSD
jgi:hypothetical protein